MFPLSAAAQRRVTHMTVRELSDRSLLVVGPRATGVSMRYRGAGALARLLADVDGALDHLPENESMGLTIHTHVPDER